MIRYLPNVLLVISLILTIVDMVWPTPQLTKVALLLVIVALISEPVLLKTQ